MSRRYKVIFLALQETEDFFKKKMSILGVIPEVSEEIINKAPVILKEHTSLEFLKKYAKAISEAGGKVVIRSINIGSSDEDILNIEPLKNFTLCPQCGYKQLKKKACEKCGFSLRRDNILSETG